MQKVEFKEVVGASMNPRTSQMDNLVVRIEVDGEKVLVTLRKYMDGSHVPFPLRGEVLLNSRGIVAGPKREALHALFLEKIVGWLEEPLEHDFRRDWTLKGTKSMVAQFLQARE